MESMSSSMLFYTLFIFLALLTGIICWIIDRLRAGAVFSLIFSMLGPVLVLFLAAQRETAVTVYQFITSEMSAGSTLARLTVFIHIYMAGWLLFLVGYLIFKAVRSEKISGKTKALTEKIRQRGKSSEV